MAAVAGSKGRIAFSVRPEDDDQSFQAMLAGRIIDGELPPTEAVDFLLRAARLREVGVDTNMICNLACQYCYLDDRPEQKASRTPEVWSNSLLSLADAGCKLVAFIGKEPLADLVALDTIGLLRKHYGGQLPFRVGMVTNGTLIGRRFDRLREAQLDYLDVSLDSFAPANDAQRGNGVYDRVIRNVAKYAATNPAHDFTVASVLHQQSATSYPEFVDHLFSLGMNSAFGSPVLGFTEQDRVTDIALSSQRVLHLLDALSARLSRLSPEDRVAKQVVIDLPYKYSWRFLIDRLVPWRSIRQDAYQAHFFKPNADVPLYVKFNFFPMSYWRAIRVTHDGSVLENMDIAAHRQYAEHARHCDDREQRWYFGAHVSYAKQFLRDFVAQHASEGASDFAIHDRHVDSQFHHLTANEAARMAAE